MLNRPAVLLQGNEPYLVFLVTLTLLLVMPLAVMAFQRAPEFVCRVTGGAYVSTHESPGTCYREKP